MPIDEFLIRHQSTEKSFSRGQDYYRNQAVFDMQRRGDTLEAHVEGSSYAPYQITITLEHDTLSAADCSCPYDWGGYCKHIVAVLLAYVHEPDSFEIRPTADMLLADLTASQLRTILQTLLTDMPALILSVEQQIALLTPTPASPTASRQRHTAIDPQSFRKQTQALFKGSGRGRYYDDDYYSSHELIEGMDGLLEKVATFLNGGDGDNALLILEAITEPFVSNWYNYAYENEFEDIFERLGQQLAEAVLRADLNESARLKWRDKLERWQHQCSDYGVDEPWDIAISAAEEGWDNPILQQILREGYQADQWQNQTPLAGDALTTVHLKILAHQERTQEYLAVAEAADDTGAYLSMLVKVGRVEEAIDYPYLTSLTEAFTLAKTLQAHDHDEQALVVAQKGLSLRSRDDNEMYRLAKWLRDLALKKGNNRLAVEMAHKAFTLLPSLADYRVIKKLAKKQWSTMKPKLLQALAESNYASEKVAIYLEEDMVDEAITFLEKQAYIDYNTLRQVAEKATKSHPEWVIRQGKKQAEAIMDAGKSNMYHYAIDWLKRVRKAYAHANQLKLWRAYLNGLIDKHYRKYSLRPSLESLRM